MIADAPYFSSRHLSHHEEITTPHLAAADHDDDVPCEVMLRLEHTKAMKQSKPDVYTISQNAKLVLLERLRHEITSKMIGDGVKKRKRKRGTAMTTCGGGVDDSNKCARGDGMASDVANKSDGAVDTNLSTRRFAKTIVRSRLIVGK